MPKENSGYPNHYEFKKNRLKVLEAVNYQCADCGGHATQVHHKDKSKDNHAIDNLHPVCCKCHVKYHSRRKTSKFKRLCNYTQREIAKLLGCSRPTIQRQFRAGNFDNILKNIELREKFPDALWLTAKEVAYMLDASNSRIDELCKEGKIPAHKLGGRWLILSSNVPRFLPSLKF